MKKIILALCLCVVAAAVGCGKSVSSSSSADIKGSSSAVMAEADITDDSGVDKSDKDDKKQKLEKYVNEQVEEAVEDNKPESFNVDGDYNFYYDGFDKVYSNDKLKKCFDKLEKICDEADFDLSFSYQSMTSNVIVSHNTYTRYLTCSTIKAPYVKSLLQQGIDLDTEITRYDCWDGDDGMIALEPYGTKHTAKELIEYAIQESDNTAYYLLWRTFGYYQFNQNLYSLGANCTLGDSWIFTYCTVTDMAKCYKDIYDFAEENEQGKWLISLMENTDLETQITAALGGKYDVAHKYGSEFDESNFHDCAIVYADSPFVLCIFTNQMPETEESCKVFKDLAKVFDDINNLIAEN